MTFVELVKRLKENPFLFKKNAEQMSSDTEMTVSSSAVPHHVRSVEIEYLPPEKFSKMPFKDIQKEIRENWELLLEARDRLEMLEKKYGKQPDPGRALQKRKSLENEGHGQNQLSS